MVVLLEMGSGSTVRSVLVPDKVFQSRIVNTLFVVIVAAENIPEEI